ncbi:MAG: molybdopterin-guanine dinucleotide biosynthesis protein B [Selenomonadaceae bacterium]|nr:molybdopterin-guanine dinucleotide biosynthesis protein B [Selenomonadaceae bacterium]
MLSFQKISLLIIAGGKSSRLGVDKRFVEVGGVGLLETILRKSAAIDFAEKFLCVEDELPALKNLAIKYGLRLIVDEIKNSGPLSAISLGLSASKTDWNLAISVDMPFFEFGAVAKLTEKFSSVQVVLPEVDGRAQPLAGFYRREVAEIFRREVLSGQRKIMAAVKKIPHELAAVDDSVAFFNVNTFAELKLARGRAENLRREMPLITVTAPKSGTGKTTFIEKLTERLTLRGVKVGVIKSDAHEFNLDVKGKDSYRFQEAGAQSVAVVSKSGWFLVNRTSERSELLSLISHMRCVDIIFIESRAHGTFPAISLWRGMGEKELRDDVVALFTTEPEKTTAIFQFDLNDVEAAETICRFLAGS